MLGAAIAVGNVLLSGLIKREFPEHAAALSGMAQPVGYPLARWVLPSSASSECA